MNPNLIIILCIILWGMWGFTNKFCNMQNSPVFVTLVTNFLYMAFSLPLLFKLKTEEINWSFSVAGFLVCTAIFGVGAKFLFNMALSQSPASGVVSATSAYPIVTLILAVIFLNEKMNFQQGLGVGLCVIGVYLITAAN